jgi:hypothetical protein
MSGNVNLVSTEGGGHVMEVVSCSHGNMVSH